MQLTFSQYGKSAVGLLKIFRDGDIQTVKEIEVSALATGDFECAFLEGDNRTTVPTDTIKNTIYALAKDHLGAAIEDFALYLADHFLGKYPMFATMTIEITEKPWARLVVGGASHAHSFQRGNGGIKTTKVVADRTTKDITSGIKDFEILKSTGSGFVGFPKCEFTTLPEVTDRILATKVTATWHYTKPVADFNATNETVIKECLAVFAVDYSKAVQQTLFDMGTKALEAVPELDSISMRLPNSHYFTYDLKRFGMENKNEIFYPAPNPHGDIAATVTR